jgi:XTP/dITP diphosphohydrolase
MMNKTLTQVVLASGNRGKLTELQSRLGALNFEVVPQSQFDIPDADETGLSFIENAILKARHAAKLSGLPAIADDSGLEVDYLQGQPGIYSARFAGVDATDEKNNAKLLASLADVPAAERSARFQCVLVFMRHENDPTPLVCQGSWEGSILTEAHGENGFGYDPLFFIEGKNCCSAELAAEEKNRISHRGKAMTLLIEKIAERKY